MSLRVYRVCRSIHAKLDGEGARLVGGRWNSPGRAMVYMSESIALAVLENLVHMNKEEFPTGFVTVSASLPRSLKILEEAELRVRFGGLSHTELGNRWFDSKLSAVACVRSAVIPAEHNYLLNPHHRDFKRIIIEQPHPFIFDPRLF